MARFATGLLLALTVATAPATAAEGAVCVGNATLGDLQEALVVQGEPVDASLQHHLDRSRDLDGLDRSGQTIVARRTLQCLGLHQRPDRLFHEKRVSALDEELLEGCQRGGVAEKHIQQFAGLFGRKRCQ